MMPTSLPSLRTISGSGTSVRAVSNLRARRSMLLT